MLIKGIEASEKRLKLFEQLRNSIGNNGFIFLRETHSSKKKKKKQMKRQLQRSSFFSYGKTNFSGVAIGYFGTKDFEVVSKACHQKGQILILDFVLNDTNFLLINIYNSN